MSEGNKTWLLVANSSHIRVIEVGTGGSSPVVLLDLKSNDTRAHPRDLGSDRPGRIQWRQTPKRGAMQPRSNYRNEEVRKFLQDVSRDFVRLCQTKTCDGIILVAPAPVARLLKDSLGSAYEERILDTINKDFTALEGNDLVSHIVKATSRWLGPLEVNAKNS